MTNMHALQPNIDAPCRLAILMLSLEFKPKRTIYSDAVYCYDDG
jgi:hypothetical protein